MSRIKSLQNFRIPEVSSTNINLSKHQCRVWTWNSFLFESLRHFCVHSLEREPCRWCVFLLFGPWATDHGTMDDHGRTLLQHISIGWKKVAIFHLVRSREARDARPGRHLNTPARPGDGTVHAGTAGKPNSSMFLGLALPGQHQENR